MATWTIGIEINGARIDAEGLVRLADVVNRDFPEFDADCAVWSGRLAVHGRVQSATPGEALSSALTIVDSAFDEAEIDTPRSSEITNVTIRRVLRAPSASDADSLPRALLRRVSPSHRHENPR